MYLKLDKKLILEVDNIHIESSLDSKLTDIEQFDEHILLAPTILKYFQKINITNLKIDNNNLSIKFDSNKLYFNSNTLLVEAIPHFYGHQIKLDIEELKLKEYNINLDGKITIDINKNKIFYLGNVTHKNQSVKLNLQADEKFVNIYATGNGSIDINLVKDFYRLDPSIEKWLYENVKGSHSLDFVAFKYDILNNTIINNSIDFNSNIKDALVYFKDGLHPVNVSKVYIKYKDNKLSFKFEDPIYRTTKINGSSLYIDNVATDKTSILHLNLKSKSILNSDIKEILQSYNISLPLTQQSGSLDTDIKINLDLSSDHLDIFGLYKLKDSTINLGGLKFDVEDATVTQNNNIVDIQASNTLLLDQQLNIDINNLKLDTSTHTASGDILINKFNIENNLIDIENINSGIYIDFKSNTKIDLPMFSTHIDVRDKTTKVTVDDISKYIQFSNLLEENGLKNGNVILDFNNDGNIGIKADITHIESALMIDNIKLSGNTYKGNTNLISADEKVKIDIDNKRTNIFIDSIDINKLNIKSKLDENPSNLIHIEAINSNILLENNKKILASKFLYKNSSNGNIHFDLNYNNTKVSFSTVNNNSTINIIDANSEFINSFMGNDDFISSGNINIHGVANESNKYLYRGEVFLKDTNFKDFTALNNILTMLQSSSAIANPLLALPTLFRVVKGDLKLNGYQAIEGHIEYAYNHEKQFLNLHDIKTRGAEIDFDGSAMIDLDKKIINSELKVIFLKDIFSIGSKIPLVNLVINKKNRIYSTVTINGDLENPETKFILFQP